MAEYGPLEERTRAGVASLGRLDDMRASLAELAYALAARMDAGAKGMAAAAIARELRETYKTLMEVADAGDAVSDLLARLSEPDVSPSVGDSA